MDALRIILSSLPATFPLPVMVVNHIAPSSTNYLTRHLDANSPLVVKEAEEKENITDGAVYVAPPNYHLLVEEDKTLSLSTSERVKYARPSIDVLFETAALAYGPALIGVVLTGGNNDGSDGLKYIKDLGGTGIVQDPATAESNSMPNAAIETANPDYILPLEDIAKTLQELASL